jgi:hypothetical protein
MGLQARCLSVYRVIVEDVGSVNCGLVKVVERSDVGER